MAVRTRSTSALASKFKYYQQVEGKLPCRGSCDTVLTPCALGGRTANLRAFRTLMVNCGAPMFERGSVLAESVTIA